MNQITISGVLDAHGRPMNDQVVKLVDIRKMNIPFIEGDLESLVEAACQYLLRKFNGNIDYAEYVPDGYYEGFEFLELDDARVFDHFVDERH